MAMGKMQDLLWVTVILGDRDGVGDLSRSAL